MNVPLKERFEKLAPKQKQQVVYGLLALAFAAVGVMVMTSSEPPRPQTAKQKIASELLPKDAAKEFGVSGIGKDVQSLTADNRKKDDQINRLQQQVSELRQKGTNSAALPPETRKELDTLRAEIEAMRQERRGAAPGNTANSIPQSMPPAPGARPQQRAGASGPPNVVTPVPASMGAQSISIRTISESNAPVSGGSASVPNGAIPAAKMLDKDGTGKVPTNYLPSGSIITGVIITGLDAATGKNAMKDPIPALIRIKHDAILPNRYRADVKECFLLASGHGDLASERAYMRAVSISCVRTDKKVIDVKVEMYAVGPDGKAGIRGRLVSKQGQMIAKASLAGLAQGIAQGFSSQSYGYNYGNNGGGVDFERAGQLGMGQGVGSAFDRIAKYYLDLADQVFPVVEIDAGQKVSFVMVKGESMGVLH